MEKAKIIANLPNLTAENIFDEIVNGNITMNELRNTGNFGINDSRYRDIKKWVKEYEEKEDDYWTAACNGNKSSMEVYLSRYPQGKHLAEAQQRIAAYEQEAQRAGMRRNEMLENIFSNRYSLMQIIKSIDDGIITEGDLLERGIPPEVVNNLRDIEAPKLNHGETPGAIPLGYTEVYFWGMQGSGKTTALAAILHKADQQGLLQITPGPGYEYAVTLKNIFTDDGLANDYLPSPTSVETTQYLPFILKNPKENFSRSISLIELSGEIFQCFLNRLAKKPFPTESHALAFKSLDRFLKSKNRKIHFFFIDYQRNNQSDSNGFKQSDYLNAAKQYFIDNQIFSKTTDGIYLVLTKSDLMVDENGNSVDSSEWGKYAKQHILERYSSFVNYLIKDCKNYSINNGHLPFEPFSLGQVYFQSICNFDGTSANRLINILLKRIAPSKKTIFDFLNR